MKHKKVTILLALALVLLLAGASVLYNGLSDQVESQNLAGETVEAQGIDQEESQLPEEETPEEERFPAPDFTVYDQDWNKVSLSDYLGTPVVINFWASWCPPCRSELPAFDQAAKDHEGEVQFMMVNLTDGERELPENAQLLIEDEGYTFPYFYDTDLSAGSAYGTASIPMTFFVDSEGYLVSYAQGAISAKTLEQGIAMILPGE